MKSIVLVISPLVSLVEDQARFLKSVGITAEYTEDKQTSEETRQLLERGAHQIVFVSPEAFLSRSDAYKERLLLIAADEAHCFSQ